MGFKDLINDIKIIFNALFFSEPKPEVKKEPETEVKKEPEPVKFTNFYESFTLREKSYELNYNYIYINKNHTGNKTMWCSHYDKNLRYSLYYYLFINEYNNKEYFKYSPNLISYIEISLYEALSCEVEEHD